MKIANSDDLPSDSEWIEADVIDGIIRQGDALLLKSTSDQIGCVKYGLVITADCDTVQHKTSGFVSYIPVISLPEYIFRFWIPEHIESKGHSVRCLDGLRKIVLDRMTQHNPEAKPLSDSGLFRLAETGDASIFGDDAVSPKDLKRLNAFLGAVKSLQVLRERAALERSLQELQHHAGNFMVQSGIGTLDSLLRKAGDSLREAVTGGGSVDIFPIGGVAASEETPQVAMLRFVRSLSEDKVTTSAAEYRFGAKLACRIARLRHEVKYECLQRFGRLFLRTGKPDSINEACRRRIDGALGLLGSTNND